MKIFNDGIKKIIIGWQNFKQAIEEFNLLIEKFKKKYPYFIKKIEANEYEILQLFNLRFGRREVNQTLKFLTTVTHQILKILQKVQEKEMKKV